ncbi:fluoride efflux transporter FluC [Galactobacter caseinivorans]|uniref:Fluoride-specific ion channel FluC n=1 Tax=Galactobacter caseinivorans TaxID=2676123 RepID=A0A496PMN5_9MICC|nr:CrcB family protein [Galactobacter caseinivorans]RKW71802.1 CrcB family protein [Galactobacter caseinivorans]
MNGLWLAVAVGGAGALGALGRVLLDDAWTAWRARRADAPDAPAARGARAGRAGRAAGPAAGRAAGWPWALLVVNVVGAFVLGLAWGLHLSHPDWAAVLGAGFCGGLTTLSTWAVAIAGAVRERRWGTAMSVFLSHLLLGGLAAWAGLALGA